LYDDEHYMRAALQQAMRAQEAGEVPVGAIVVYQDEIIASAHNGREGTQDPTAHAELVAIREASRVLGSWRLIDTTVYVTLEPCPMCAGVMVNARVPTVVFGATDPKAGAVCSLYTLLNDNRLNHRVEVRSGVLETECSLVLTDFFRGIREKSKKL
jgi:tRNA(adenine34) deaminase